MFGFDLHTWEEIMIWSLGVAAIAALSVLVSTRVVIILQRDALRESAEDFAKYKIDPGGHPNSSTCGHPKLLHPEQM